MPLQEDLIQAVWEKARALPDQDPGEWRQDQCGAWINRGQLDNADSDFGWHMVRVAPEGTDDPKDLEPFHMANGFDIGNGQPRCEVTADLSGPEGGRTVGPPRNTSA